MQVVNVDLMRSTQGVPTRRVKEITTELCGREFSKWAAPRLNGELDEQVEAWASRSLEEQSDPFLVLWGPAPEGSALGLALDELDVFRRQRHERASSQCPGPPNQKKGAVTKRGEREFSGGPVVGSRGAGQVLDN